MCRSILTFCFYVLPSRAGSARLEIYTAPKAGIVLIRSLNFILQLIAYSSLKKKKKPTAVDKKKNKSRNCWGPADKKPAPRQQQMAFSLSLFSPSFYWAHYLSFVSVGYILAKGSALSTLFLI